MCWAQYLRILNKLNSSKDLCSKMANHRGYSYSPVLFWNVQGHHEERFSTLHHPAQPLTHSAYLWVEEAIGHTTPDNRGQHLDVQSGRALGDWVRTFAAEHGCRDGHDVLRRGETEKGRSICNNRIKNSST